MAFPTRRIVAPLLGAVLLAGVAGCRTHTPLATPASPAVAETCLKPLASTTPDERLRELRTQIDCADRALARLVGERLAVAGRIGDVKREMGAPVVDTTREAVVVERFARLAAEHGVDAATAEAVIRTLIQAARARQE